MSTKTHQYWLEQTIQLAVENVKKGGGPFAAIVVKEGEIISTGVNEIQNHQDPTAHAELLAISRACQKLQTTDLSECILYASGEPCPMCVGAIYWSRPKAVYFACSKHEAAERTGFGDPLAHMYEDLQREPQLRVQRIEQIDCAKRALLPFQTWQKQQQQ